MVKCGVLFEVRTEFLNFIKTSVGFKGLANVYEHNFAKMHCTSVAVHWTWAWDRILVKSIFFFVSCSCHVILRHKNNYRTNLLYFSKTHNLTSCIELQLSGASALHISQIRSSAMLILSIVGNRKYDFTVDPNSIMPTPNFRLNTSRDSRTQSCGQTERSALYAFISCTYSKECIIADCLLFITMNCFLNIFIIMSSFRDW
jgi:hypothetical protein